MREMTVALLLGVPLMIYGVMYVVAQTFIALERKVFVQREVEGIFKHWRVTQEIAKDVATLS